ncbi:uncharacterized protein At5g01610-like [Rutidosis leptorrhynchoides]|uniref:uncharacterized protein At5g01610-like n=1 Tax=Rutidosis leptorrhynchoides TaxID=125765 RepID=UPI003A998445
MEMPIMVILCLYLCLPVPPANGDDMPSAYQVLQSYNLPIGLLPKGALGYNLDPNSGRFAVNLSSNCDVHVGDYKIKYDPIITGVISKNNLRRLGGVKVKIALFWIDIENVNRNQDHLAFKMGNVANKEFPTSDFKSCPKCY